MCVSHYVGNTIIIYLLCHLSVMYIFHPVYSTVVVYAVVVEPCLLPIMALMCISHYVMYGTVPGTALRICGYTQGYT